MRRRDIDLAGDVGDVGTSVALGRWDIDLAGASVALGAGPLALFGAFLKEGVDKHLF